MRGDEFVKLQKEWYSKLKASGFRDIERTRDVDGQAFDRGLFSDSRHVLHSVMAESEEYWHLCRSWMYHSPTFQGLPALDRAVWEAYCDGATYREIARKVGKPLTSVHNSIQRMKTKALQERGTIADEPDDEEAPQSTSVQMAVRRPWHT